MSDARAAAWLVSIYGKGMLEHSGPSRWVFFGAKKTTLFGRWHKLKGIQFSNLSWRPFRPEPKPNRPASIPEPAARKETPQRELWDLSSVPDYWDILSRKKFTKELLRLSPKVI